MRRRTEAVAVTGLGAVTAWGAGVAALERGARSGGCAISAFAGFGHGAHRTSVAATIGEATELGAPTRARPSSRAEDFALTAASEAMSEARPTSPPGEIGLVLAATTGGLWESERFYELLRGSAGRRAPLALLAQQPICAPAEHVARRLGLGGPVLTVSSACASGTLALELAVEALRAGEVETVLVLGADALAETVHAGFNALRAVDPAPCRPFRADRAGLSLGEGAAALVLENERAARERGARVRALVSGVGSSCDAAHVTAPLDSGAGILAAMRAALDDAGLEPAEVDFVNAHGTGTPQNDAAEARALRELLGERAAEVPVVATKASLGHLLGAAGALEALSTVLALESGELPAVPGGGSVEAGLGVDLVLGSPRRPERCRHALSLNLAFGGANAAAVLSRAESGA